MWRVKLVIGIVALAMAVGACQPSNPDIAMQFKRDADHSGVFDGREISAHPSVKWAFKTGGRIFSSPVVCQDVLYIGSDDSCLYAVDAENGSLKWKFMTGGRIRSTPALYHDTVFFLSYDGKFYALDAASGTKRWTFETGGEHPFRAPGIHGLLPADRMISDDWDVWLSSPTIANGRVYFGSSDGNIYALDARDGRELWHFKTGNVVHDSPAVSGGMVFVGSWDRNMYALDASTGKEKWRFTTGSDTVYYNQTGIQGSPLVVDSLLYFGCRDAHVYCLNKFTGRMLWSYNTKGSWVIVTPTLYKGILFAVTSDSHRLLVMDPFSGKVLSENDTKIYVFGSPVTDHGVIYVPTFGGSLLAFSADSTRLLWNWQTKAARIDRRNALTPDRHTTPGIFFSRNASDAPAAMNRIYSAGSILSTPWIEDGTIYFGSTDSMVYALE